jgi:hypothetical protein
LNKKIGELVAELERTTNETINAQRQMMVEFEGKLRRYQGAELGIREAYRLLVQGEVEGARNVLLQVLMKWPSN